MLILSHIRYRINVHWLLFLYFSGMYLADLTFIEEGNEHIVGTIDFRFRFIFLFLWFCELLAHDKRLPQGRRRPRVRHFCSIDFVFLLLLLSIPTFCLLLLGNDWRCKTARCFAWWRISKVFFEPFSLSWQREHWCYVFESFNQFVV